MQAWESEGGDSYGQEVLRLLLWAESDASYDMRVCECVQAFTGVRIPDFTFTWEVVISLRRPEVIPRCRKRCL